MPFEEDAKNQATNQQQVLVTAKLHTMNVKLHLGIKLHLDAKLQNEEEALFDSKISRDTELPDRDAYSDSKAERSNEETRAKPRLSKYVKRHHLVAKNHWR